MEFTCDFKHTMIKLEEDGKDGARDIWLQRGHSAASGLINLNYAS